MIISCGVARCRCKAAHNKGGQHWSRGVDIGRGWLIHILAYFYSDILRVSNVVDARQAWAILVNSGQLLTNTCGTSNNTIGTTSCHVLFVCGFPPMLLASLGERRVIVSMAYNRECSDCDIPLTLISVSLSSHFPRS